jgi:hypothetical protein
MRINDYHLRFGTRKAELRNASDNLKGKAIFRWKDSIKTDLKDTECEDMD